ncbi:MAG: HEPN domain-containing protein [Burkholderiaceae bacterium]|jgi:hypothetical protein|nr:HEPN domain-containing protein [Burkholderiaceae bacterium]
MRAELADFNAGLDQLVRFLERTERENELVGLLNARRQELEAQEAALLQQLVERSTHTRQYVYAVGIVSLYGLLEQLVDGLVVSFVNHLGGFAKGYEALPESFRTRHLEQSLALATALLKDRFRTETTHERVVANLHSCLMARESGFTLNGHAFALHRGNHNLARITDLLSGVGIQSHLRRVVSTPAFKAHLVAQAPERDWSVMADTEVERLFEPIDDLVRRRNDVSHGAMTADQLESVPLLMERCDLVRAYGVGLHELILQEAMKHAAELGAARALGQPLEVYDNRIVCFEATGPIAVGDRLFAVTADALQPVRHSQVLRLEIDRQAFPSIDSAAPVRFGVEVCFHADRRHRYFMLASDRL